MTVEASPTLVHAWLIEKGWEIHADLSSPAQPVYHSPHERREEYSGFDIEHALTLQMLTDCGQ